jgi:multiple sugar transport system ATP-binding protein
VQVAEHLGSDTFLYIDIPSAGLFTARATGEFALEPGDTVRVRPDPQRIHRFGEAGLAIR